MKIFVINLDHRSDRLAFISNQLKNLEWERFPAINGHLLSLEDIKTMGFSPAQDWADPMIGRPLTYTEIATSISHFKLWEKCVELDEPILILEDDVHMARSLSTDQLLSVLNSTDIVYLDHREMFTDRTTDLNEELFAPYYPYLNSAYAITPSLAKKLINSDFKNNVVPVDEFFPCLLGVNYYDTCLSNDLFIQKTLIDLQKKYADIIPIRGAAYKRNIFKQVSRSILGSDIESGKKIKESDIIMNDKVHVFTVGTDESKMLNFNKTADKFNIKYTNLGHGVVWEGGSTNGPACGQKLNLVKQAIKDLEDTDIVLFCDGYDVVFNDDLSTVVDRYKGFDCELLFGAEKNCWPDKNLAPFFTNSITEYKYLNSGLYIGKVGILKEILSNSISNTSDDQYYMQIEYLKYEKTGKIKLDFENYIFQNMGGAYEDITLKPNNQLLNTATRCCPCILHGNGGPQDKANFLKFIAPLVSDKPSNSIIEYIPASNYTVVSNEIIEMDFLTEEMCDKLVLLAEQYGKWESMYGDKFPGQEVRLRSINVRLFEELEEHFNSTVNKVIEKYWWPTLMYGLRDAFIIKYSPGTQTKLNCHNDASMVSGIVKLNTGYTGGDTYFRRQDFSNINTKKGNIILWPGQVTHGHEGREVTSGTKYNLVIWTSRMKKDINY
jgi:GR25 family glycosyltransferase involved in LPS biosynthesis